MKRVVLLRLLRVIFALLVFITVSPLVLSIGLSSDQLPSLSFFESGKEIIIPIRCYDFTDDCELSISGSFASSTVFTKFVDTGTNEKRAVVNLVLPNEEPAPGRHATYITVTDVDNSQTSGILVTARVRKKVNFFVLHDTPYAEVLFRLPNINQGNNLTAEFDVSNFGKPDLLMVYGTVDIFSFNGTKLGTMRTATNQISTMATKTLRADWESTGYLPGEYLAKATLFYDGEFQEFNTSFIIGEKEVELINYTSSFERGKISPMSIRVKNNWKGTIENVFASVFIEGVESKTPSFSLIAFESRVLTTYVDTSLLLTQDYPIEIRLFFDGFQKIQEGSITITEPEKTKNYFPLEFGVNLTTLVLLIILILFILNIIFITKSFKKRKEVPLPPIPPKNEG